MLLFAEPMKTKLTVAPVRGRLRRGAHRRPEIFFIAYKKPDGTYLGRSKSPTRKPIEKGHLVTMRNWNTIEKAAAL